MSQHVKIEVLSADLAVINSFLRLLVESGTHVNEQIVHLVLGR